MSVAAWLFSKGPYAYLVCVYVYMYIHIYMYVYIYICMYIHTYLRPMTVPKWALSGIAPWA